MRPVLIRDFLAVLALFTALLTVSLPARAAVYDFMAENEPLVFQLDKFGPVEATGKGSFRWAFGPSCSIKFRSSRSATAVLRFAFRSPVAGQSITVSVNGKTVREVKDIPFSPANEVPTSLEVELPVQSGDNAVVLTFGDWNHGKTVFVQVDDRPFALGLTALSIEFDKKIAASAEPGGLSGLLAALASPSGDWHDFQAGKGSGRQAVTGVEHGKDTLFVFGDRANALFSSTIQGDAELSFSMRSKLNGSVSVWANGVRVAAVALDAGGEAFSGHTVRFRCVKGLNEVSLRLDSSDIAWAGIMPVPGKPSAELASFSCRVVPVKQRALL